MLQALILLLGIQQVDETKFDAFLLYSDSQEYLVCVGSLYKMTPEGWVDITSPEHQECPAELPPTFIPES